MIADEPSSAALLNEIHTNNVWASAFVQQNEYAGLRPGLTDVDTQICDWSRDADFIITIDGQDSARQY